MGVLTAYDVTYDVGMGGYAVTGVHVTDVPAVCAGRPMTVTLLGEAGPAPTSGTVAADGSGQVTVKVGPADARTVAALQVTADR